MSTASHVRPRILCVAEDFPWPSRDGYRIRLSNVVKALSEVGELELFAANRRPDEPRSIPADLELARVEVVPAPKLLPVDARLLARTLSSPLPKRVLWHDWTAARRRLRDWSALRYDLVWYGHPDSRAGFGPVPAGATILDADNLEDMRERSLRDAHLRSLGSLLAAPRPSAEYARDVRSRVKGIVSSTLDARRWRALQGRLATEADAVVVCSELDRRRLGAPNAVVIPNGYEEPSASRARPGRGDAMVMIGRFAYPPNADGARFFVREILPRIRERLPDAAVRLVGRDEGLLEDLRYLDGVTVTGEVPDVSDELARSRVAVVPLRAGSGTRLKVLEAFAFGVPVVSTALGCEGLDAVSGRHLLVADRPQEFADACVRLLSEDTLHERITGEAWSLFESRYRWEDIRRSISELASSVIDRSAVRPVTARAGHRPARPGTG
jgi:glycosyltransferase involved in cell wall biosynthesis